MRLECISAEGNIARFEPEWSALWRQVPGASPFQSPAWLLPWRRHFATGTPQILACRSTGTLVGALPLYRHREAKGCKLLPIGIGISDYCDALVDPACPSAADALLGAAADLPDWAELHVPDLPPGAALLAARCPARLAEDSHATVPCPVLDLPATVGDLPRAVPRKTLRDLRQATARAGAHGAVRIERAAGDEIGPALDDLFRLHEKRWQRRGQAGVCAAPAVQAFHRDAARALDAAGLLRLYRLRIAGATMAVYYGFLHNGRAYAYLGGFDPDQPRLSPGALIVGHAIAEAIGEGARAFDFLRGGEAYKYAWGAVDRWNSARTLRPR